MADSLPEDQPTLSVGQLCHIVDQTFATLFPDEVWIKGSISGLKRSANGHVYFDLIDPDEVGGAPAAVLPVALFANAKFRVNAILKRTGSVRMADGIEIRIRGRLTYYPRQSRVQLIMSLIDPSYTLGQMEMARAQLIGQLREEGLLEANGLRKLPVAPLALALITSRGSAAEADFLHELDSSGLPFVVHPFDTRVQGDEAVASIVAALAEADAAPVDAIALVRGGGARTDLAAFDHEQVARAIAGCSLPVVVGVGHEIDRSVADEVAHTSAKTPTAAAGIFIDACLRFRDRIATAKQRIGRAALSAVDRQGFELERIEERVARAATARVEHEERTLARIDERIARTAAARIEDEARALDQIDERLRRTIAVQLERAASQLEHAAVRSRALDPAVALARGWSITRDGTGAVVRNAAELDEGDVLHTTLADGTVRSTVKRS